MAVLYRINVWVVEWVNCRVRVRVRTLRVRVTIPESWLALMSRLGSELGP